MAEKYYEQLRAKAKALLDSTQKDKQTFASKDEMLEELAVRQIELEMQNRELLESIAAAEHWQHKHYEQYNFAPIALMTFNSQGIIFEMNRAASYLLNIESRLLINYPLITYIKQNLRATFVKHLVATFQTDASHEVELVLNPAFDAESRHVRLISQRYYDNLDEQYYCRSAFIDQTLRKQEETHLRQTTIRLKTVIQTVGEGITLSSPAGNFEIFNPKMEEFTGYTMDEANKADDFLKLVYPDDRYRRLVVRQIEKLREKGCLDNIETRIITKNGKQKTLLVSSVLLNDTPEPAFLSVYHDITHRIKSADRLRAMKEQLELAMDGGNIIWWTWDISNNRLNYDKRIAKMLGFELDELDDFLNNQSDFNKLIHPEDLERVQLAADRHIRGELNELNVDFRVRTKDGNYRWVYDHGRVVKRDSQGNILLISGIIVDVTERKELEAALLKQTEQVRRINEALRLQNKQIESQKNSLQELNATKDKFFSIIAHDLKNPFGTILGFAEMLYTDYDYLNEDKRRMYSQQIYEAANLVQDLLENLLDWSRSQIGRLDFVPEQIDVKELVNNTFMLFVQIAHDKDIEMKASIEDSVCLRGDRQMLTTILRNLLSNALKFTSPGGKIQITQQKHRDSLQLTVSDTGVGIALKDMDKLFRLDAHLSKKGTANESGTGLGLILCKEFVERHGGRIWAESLEGHGTSFHFTIPLCNSGKSAAADIDAKH